MKNDRRNTKSSVPDLKEGKKSQKRKSGESRASGSPHLPYGAASEQYVWKTGFSI